MTTRQIKFRAFNKKQKVLVYDNEDDTEDYWDGVIASNVGIVNAGLEDDRYVWMQFTGLHDKNGKLIFEGDVIEFYNKRKIVEWNDQELSFLAKDVKEGFYQKFCNNSLIEIIGDIYTTPELLSTHE